VGIQEKEKEVASEISKDMRCQFYGIWSEKKRLKLLRGLNAQGKDPVERES
jgi:hypothetical protein